MQITFVTDVGESYALEIDPNMELENIMALLEAECGIPLAEQSISYNGVELVNPKETVAQCGVREGAMILLRRRVMVAGRSVEQDAEMMRLQVLGNPHLMNQLRQTQPELAQAAAEDPARFAALLRQVRARQEAVEAQRIHESEVLNSDPYDVEAQRRIEEAIRQEAVMENLSHALEYSPEFFGRVHMLYGVINKRSIPLEVNGYPIKAFVDSGAQQTIMSPECAERCGIMRLIDTRFSGIAKGVGTAKILGRVHSAQLKVADLHLPCAFTIMEGRDVDLLFGLDMLKAHQGIIDLENDCLRIKGREVRFLPEHELPDNARLPFTPTGSTPSTPSTSTAPSIPEVGRHRQPFPHPQPQPQQPPANRFPGTGQAIGHRSQPSSSRGTHAPGGLGSGAGAPAPPANPGFSENDIQIIMNFGVTREIAIETLRAAGGNVDVAASFLFN